MSNLGSELADFGLAISIPRGGMLVAVQSAVGLVPCVPLVQRAPFVPARMASPLANEIPYDIKFLRTAKAALRKALEEEGGALDDDARACVEALNVANPSLPNPAEDNDLWSGAWSFQTASLFSTAIRAEGSVNVDESGELELTCTLTSGESVGTLSMQARVAAAADTVLELQCERIALSSEALVSACSEATGLSLEPTEDGAQWLASEPLPALKLAQLYLDQDMHIVGRAALADGEDEATSDPLVLVKERRSA